MIILKEKETWWCYYNHHTSCKRKMDVYNSCYSGVLIEILHYYNCLVPELKLFESEKLLEIGCSENQPGLYSNLEAIVNNSLKKHGIYVRRIKVGSKEDLKKKLKYYGRLLVNLDISYLSYTKIFTESKSSQRRHYLILSEMLDESNVRIIDTYIPTTPFITTFEGEIAIPIQELVNNIYFVDTKQFCLKSYNRKNLLSKMLFNYEISVNKMVFEKFYEKIITSISKKNYHDLYEMSISLSTSGVITTRKMLYEYIKKLEKLPYTLVWETQSLEKKYNALRLLLLKAYVQPDEVNLADILLKLKYIKEFEKNLYKQIANYKE